MRIQPESSADEQNKIRHQARLIHALSMALFVGSVAFAGARWVNLGASESSGWLPEMMRLNALSGPVQLGVPWRVLGFVLECVPLLALAGVLKHLTKLCKAFAQGSFFHGDVVHSFRRMGWGMLLLVVAQMVYNVSVTALLTWRAHVERGLSGGSIAVGVSAFELGLLLIGATMLLLARVIAQGQDMQDDLAKFV